MRSNRSADTRPELRLRSALHRSGLRFRKAMPLTAGEVRVRPDLIFTRARVVVFVDGCFWHGCATHGTTPRSNTGYWSPKLASNAERDRRVDRALTSSGWEVIRVWEHEVWNDIGASVGRVVARVRKPPSP
jgi:DNA mismatch endonuclease, patch repair protein